MLYKPSYCCHCGEKVERIDWKLWTSTRFCENCESSFPGVKWMPRIFAGVAALSAIFGFGSYLKTPEKQLNLSSNQISAGLVNKPKPETKDSTISAEKPTLASKENSNTESKAANSAKTMNNVQNLPKPQKSEIEQDETSDPVYYCGAQTKKGSACTRKVKGGNRCWQHEGLPAMAAKEKLKVVE